MPNLSEVYASHVLEQVAGMIADELVEVACV